MIASFQYPLSQNNNAVSKGKQSPVYRISFYCSFVDTHKNYGKYVCEG